MILAAWDEGGFYGKIETSGFYIAFERVAARRKHYARSDCDAC